MSEKITIDRDVMRAVLEILEIAGDWNAPTHYDIVPPEGWEDTRDADSAEPNWVALYLFVPKLRALVSEPSQS